MCVRVRVCGCVCGCARLDAAGIRECFRESFKLEYAARLDAAAHGVAVVRSRLAGDKALGLGPGLG